MYNYENSELFKEKSLKKFDINLPEVSIDKNKKKIKIKRKPGKLKSKDDEELSNVSKYTIRSSKVNSKFKGTPVNTNYMFETGQTFKKDDLPKISNSKSVFKPVV